MLGVRILSHFGNTFGTRLNSSLELCIQLVPSCIFRGVITKTLSSIVINNNSVTCVCMTVWLFMPSDKSLLKHTYFGFFSLFGFFIFNTRYSGSRVLPINGGDVTSVTISTYSPRMFKTKTSDYISSLPSHVQGLEMITFIIYNPWLQTSFLLISDYLENPVLE